MKLEFTAQVRATAKVSTEEYERARAEVVKRKQSTGIILTEDNELHVVCDEMVNGMVDDPVRILDLDGLIIDAVNCRGFLPLTFCVKRIDG